MLFPLGPNRSSSGSASSSKMVALGKGLGLGLAATSGGLLGFLELQVHKKRGGSGESVASRCLCLEGSRPAPDQGAGTPQPYLVTHMFWGLPVLLRGR